MDNMNDSFSRIRNAQEKFMKREGYHPERLTPVNNMKRQEKILVLPYNTLRLVDTFVQVEIEKSKNPKWFMNLEDVIYMLITRKEKDLGKFNKVDSNVVKACLEEDWARYYEIAPRTLIYGLLEFLEKQSFVSDIIALFHKKDCYDEALKCDYYDGTIEGLDKYIEENEITAIIMDDIELLKTLIERKKIDLSWKTFFISRLGYNFFRSPNGTLLMKYVINLTNEVPIEIGCLALMNFDREFLINKFGK